jgi:hypothetical protein
MFRVSSSELALTGKKGCSSCLSCLVFHGAQVRVYFPKRLAQQLEAAREEYVRATAGVWKDHRVLLPKLLDAYARDAGLSPDRLLDAVQRCLPETLRTAVHRCRHGDGGGGGGRSAGKVVEWVPHRQSFRYLLARDLAFPHLS